jgi:triosephosphate isomerase
MMIRKKIPLKVVYGGSVNEKNTLQLLSLDEVDGALIGRCSLSADKFIQICNLAHQI